MKQELCNILKMQETAYRGLSHGFALIIDIYNNKEEQPKLGSYDDKCIKMAMDKYGSFDPKLIHLSEDID